jgi:hypothetical protein
MIIPRFDLGFVVLLKAQECSVVVRQHPVMKPLLK